MRTFRVSECQGFCITQGSLSRSHDILLYGECCTLPQPRSILRGIRDGREKKARNVLTTLRSIVIRNKDTGATLKRIFKNNLTRLNKKKKKKKKHSTINRIRNRLDPFLGRNWTNLFKGIADIDLEKKIPKLRTSIIAR